MIRILNIFAFFLIFVFVGCSNTATTEKPVPAGPLPVPKNALTPKPEKNTVVAVTAQPAVQQVTTPPALKADPPPPAVYAYNPEGRKDPFKPFLLGGSSRVSNPAFPLLNYPVSDLKLVAIMGLKKNHFLAMVQTPDGKGYTIRAGMEVGINRGKVKEVTSQSVFIEEDYTEVSGEKKKRTVILSLRPPEEGQI